MRNGTRRLVTIALCGALAFILIGFDFPILPQAPFLQIDFSDIVVLLTTFIYGPGGGLGVVVIRNLIHYLTTGGEAGYPIGDIANIIATIAYSAPIYLLLRDVYQTTVKNAQVKQRQLGRVIGAYALATVLLTLVMSVLNYFVITPFYIQVIHFPIPDLGQYILTLIIPFNLIKGVIVGIVSHLALRLLLPIAKRRLVEA